MGRSRRRACHDANIEEKGRKIRRTTFCFPFGEISVAPVSAHVHGEGAFLSGWPRRAAPLDRGESSSCHVHLGWGASSWCTNIQHHATTGKGSRTVPLRTGEAEICAHVPCRFHLDKEVRSPYRPLSQTPLKCGLAFPVIGVHRTRRIAAPNVATDPMYGLAA